MMAQVSRAAADTERTLRAEIGRLEAELRKARLDGHAADLRAAPKLGAQYYRGEGNHAARGEIHMEAWRPNRKVRLARRRPPVLGS
jgi:hypothetical protein